MFQNPQSCSWLVVWWNQFGPQDPNQIHWHQKPTRRHTDQGKCHTNHLLCLFDMPFQFYQLLWSDVEKNAKRCWCRKSYSKIEADDEFGLAMQWKGLLTCLPPLHQKARRKPDMKVKYLWAQELSSTWERGDLLSTFPASYPGWEDDKAWSSQEWKSDDVMEVRTGRPVDEQPPGLFAEHADRFIVDDDDMDFNTVAESDMSLKIQIILAQGEWSSAKDAGPILKRCNTRQQQTFFKMVNVYVFDITSICFHEKGRLRQFTFHKNTEKLTMKQMFDISEKLIVGQSDEIFGVSPTNWEDSSWKHLSLIGGEKVISLSHTGLRIFRFCVMPWKDEREPTIKLCMGRQVDVVQKFIRIQSLDTIDGEPMEFEWNIFPGFNTLQLCNKVQEFLSNMSTEPEDFTGRIIFMSMFNDISWGSKENEREYELSANLVSMNAKRFSPGQKCHSSDLSQKSGILLMIANHKENGTESLNNWWWTSQIADTQFSVLRVHCHEERSKAKVVENYQYIFALTRERLKLFFAQLFLLISSVFSEQSHICVKTAKPAM